MDTIGSRIRAARTAADLTQAAVATKLGISRVSVTQWENGTTAPDRERLADLAEFLRTTVEWLLEARGEPPARTEPQVTKRQAGFSPTIIAGEELVNGSQRLPVFSGAQGGAGHLIVSFDQIDSLKMPAVLENVRGGYGLLVREGSMYPAFRDGDIALMHPHLQPSRDTNVVLYHTQPSSGEVEAIIKQLNGWNDREWHLEQFSPPMKFSESRADWPIVHRCVGRYDRR